MRLSPAQIAVKLVCGKELKFLSPDEQPLKQRIRDGHDDLVRLTGVDYGYDLQAWHDHLKESREGGYMYGRNIILPRIMKEALESAEWRAAVAEIEEESREAPARRPISAE